MRLHPNQTFVQIKTEVITFKIWRYNLSYVFTVDIVFITNHSQDVGIALLIVENYCLERISA